MKLVVASNYEDKATTILTAKPAVQHARTQKWFTPSLKIPTNAFFGQERHYKKPA
jgi:hypothetical protein